VVAVDGRLGAENPAEVQHVVSLAAVTMVAGVVKVAFEHLD
jgi:hypothetical protein